MFVTKLLGKCVNVNIRLTVLTTNTPVGSVKSSNSRRWNQDHNLLLQRRGEVGPKNCLQTALIAARKRKLEPLVSRRLSRLFTTEKLGLATEASLVRAGKRKQA